MEKSKDWKERATARQIRFGRYGRYGRTASQTFLDLINLAVLLDPKGKSGRANPFPPQDSLSKNVLTRYAENLRKANRIEIEQVSEAVPNNWMKCTQWKSGDIHVYSSYGFRFDRSAAENADGSAMNGFEPFAEREVPAYLKQVNVSEVTFHNKPAYVFQNGYAGTEERFVYIDKESLKPVGWSLVGGNSKQVFYYRTVVID